MRAILVREFGAPDVLRLETVPDPEIQAGEVLIAVRAAGVNPVDTYIRTGNHAIKPPLPYIPGFDLAGTVAATGAGVTGLAVGQRVYNSGLVRRPVNGAYAELAVCQRAQVHPLPDHVSFEQGAGLNTPYGTAARALIQRGGARPGEWVLVHGGSGGVGTAAIQLSRVLGLRIIATAGTDEGLELVRRQGAHHALNHRQPEYLDEVRTITEGHGIDLVIEMLANVNLERDLAVVAHRGRVCVIGNRGTIEIDPRKAMTKDAAILGVQYGNTTADELASLHAFIGAGLESKALSPVVGRSMPLADAPTAHAAVMQPGARGKIVLAV